MQPELDPVGHQWPMKPEKDVGTRISGFPKDAGFSMIGSISLKPQWSFVTEFNLSLAYKNYIFMDSRVTRADRT